MTDRQLHKAKRLLDGGVSASEAAALTGLSVGQVERLAASIAMRKDASGGDLAFELRNAMREEVEKRLIDCLREMLEFGYGPQELADWLGPMIDTVAGVLADGDREKNFRAMLAGKKAEPVSPAKAFEPADGGCRDKNIPAQIKHRANSRRLFAEIFGR